MKLIKLNEQHYIVVDDSEIKEGNYDFSVNYRTITYVDKERVEMHKTTAYKGLYKKITHSTQPLEAPVAINGFNTYDFISLSEVEEAVNGYSVEKMAIKYGKEYNHLDGDIIYDHPEYFAGFHDGINAHKELVKDKLFTVEDMEKCFKNGFLANDDVFASKEFAWIKYEKALLPKTEWGVEFDEQGKLKLI